MTNLIGLCGYARVGKDTAAANMLGWKRYAFADLLKDDLRDLLRKIEADLRNSTHKEKCRPLLVAWGATARAFRPDFWVDRLFDYVRDSLNDGQTVVITDVRYENEVSEILKYGGVVIRISRPGFGPANDEEGRSIDRIKIRWPDMPSVYNDSTPAELGRRVMEIVGILSER